MFPPKDSYDPEAARRLLAEAGFPDGKGFPLTRSCTTKASKIATLRSSLQAMWLQHLGVKVNLALQEWKVYLNSLSSLDYGIARSSWVGDYPDPNTFLDMFVTGNGNNRTGWSDPAYDRLIGMPPRKPIPPTLRDLRQAEAILVSQQVPVCPIFYYVGIQLYDPAKLGGIESNVLDEHPLKAMYRRPLAA